jgi:hypothetical protein
MAKVHLAHQERLADMQAFGKDVGKRASFKCEWCEGRENLCQSALKIDPPSASKIDPPQRLVFV